MTNETSRETHYRDVYEHPKNSGTWWINYYANGRRHREKCGKKSTAIKRYSIRKAEIMEGTYFDRRRSRTVGELVELTFQDYRINGKKLEPIETCWKRLKSTFSDLRVNTLTTDDLQRYIARQLRNGYSAASTNRDLALLKRTFNLALRATPSKVQNVPLFPTRLRESPPRSGFVEEEQFRTLLDNAPETWLRCFLMIAYNYGFRRAEILGLRVSNIEKDFIRLAHGTTKNREGRIAPLTLEVRKYVELCCVGKKPGDYLLSRNLKNGDHREQILDFRGAWARLIGDAGIPNLMVHDLRRSAVRNMVRRGISEKVAMQISGHKTRTVFDRYNLTSELDILEAGKLLETRKGAATRTSTKHLPVNSRKIGKLRKIS